MNKLSKEKRQQLVLALVVTAVAVAGLWFGVIKSQKDRLHKLAEKKQAADTRLHQVKQAVENADRIETQLGEAGKRLTKLEDGMATGDLYSWAINAIRQFKMPYKVEIPQFSQIDGPKDSSLLPQFPYKQATLTISGTGYFHDVGKFIADFENEFPYFRVLNLTLEPASALTGADREKLSFKMDIVALVKPGVS